MPAIVNATEDAVGVRIRDLLSVLSPEKRSQASGAQLFSIMRVFQGREEQAPGV